MCERTHANVWGQNGPRSRAAVPHWGAPYLCQRGIVFATFGLLVVKDEADPHALL